MVKIALELNSFANEVLKNTPVFVIIKIMFCEKPLELKQLPKKYAYMPDLAVGIKGVNKPMITGL